MDPAEWLAKLLSGGEHPSEFVLSDGRTVSIACIQSKSGGWVLTCDDVSRLARIESDLAEQNRRFDAALNNMPHGLCMFDAAKKLILCNASYARMYELPATLTQPGTLLDEILEYRSTAGNGPVNKATYFDVVIEATATGSAASQNISLTDGRVIKISHNPMGKGGYVATHENVTKTVRISEELLRHRDTLEVTVKLRTEEIERQAHELERMLDQERNINELQRQFVTMASHEFRTPLTIIDAAAQRLLRRKGNLEPEFLEEKIDQIRTSVSRIVDLMESILSAGRLDNGIVDIRYEVCTLRDLINGCCERQAMIAKTHRFLLDLDRLPEFIDADRRTLEQVFTNLLSNAVKYAPSAPDIHISGWEELGNVKIAVRDTGIGIDTEDMPRMFQRYFRARTSTGIAGTGIGLNLVKQIVELHQGSIEVVSERGLGSTFTVTLPMKPGTDTARLPSYTDAA
jgi:signal transduction histidine kinase